MEIFGLENISYTYKGDNNAIDNLSFNVREGESVTIIGTIGEDHCLLKEGLPNEILKDRDILLKANLIHKHPHRHSWFIHDHSHYAEHEHEHLPESVHTQESIPVKKADGEITDIGKLKKLLDHWIEHNISHKETYEEWARRMSAILKEDRADILKKIAEETGEIDKLFLRLKGIL